MGRAKAETRLRRKSQKLEISSTAKPSRLSDQNSKTLSKDQLLVQKGLAVYRNHIRPYDFHESQFSKTNFPKKDF